MLNLGYRPQVWDLGDALSTRLKSEGGTNPTNSCFFFCRRNLIQKSRISSQRECTNDYFKIYSTNSQA